MSTFVDDGMTLVLGVLSPFRKTAVLVGTLMLIAVPSSLAAARKPGLKSARPLMVHPRWHMAVRTGFTDAGANDRYVAIIQRSSPTAQLTLIDERSGTRQVLSPPACAGPNSLETSPVFGGPYLMVQCGSTSAHLLTYGLYNLDGGQWTSFAVSSQCRGSCPAIAIGRDWVKLASDEGMVGHVPNHYYLQNLQTGAFERDPVAGGDRVFDDLNAPSGSSSLCAPLRYPRLYNGSYPEWEPGLLTFYGQFALTLEGGSPANPSTAYHLRRCESRLNLVIPSGWENSRYLPVSSRAVMLTHSGKTISGWLLPSLRGVTISTPAATQAPRCRIGRHGVIPVALTARTIYVRALCGNQALWAAALPAANH